MTEQCLYCQTAIRQPLNIRTIFGLCARQKKVLCQACNAELKRLGSGSQCLGCWRQMDEEGYCQECEEWLEQVPNQLVCHRALYAYNDFAREWMHYFKRLGDVRYGQIWSSALEQMIDVLVENAVMVPIPSSKESLTVRGFNPIQVIVDTLKYPQMPLLRYVGEAQHQSNKTRQERLKSQQPFAINREYSYCPKRVVLIDDVYTTGRTLMHAKELLWAAGVEELYSVSLFR